MSKAATTFGNGMSNILKRQVIKKMFSVILAACFLLKPLGSSKLYASKSLYVYENGRHYCIFITQVIAKNSFYGKRFMLLRNVVEINSNEIMSCASVN